MRARTLGAPSLLLVLAAPAVSFAAGEPEVAMFGQTPSRNMVSSAKGLPTRFDVASGLNVKWVAELGSRSYGGPVVAGGRVFVGSNNQHLYNPKLAGDRGSVLVFDAKTGELLWQAAHAKLPAGQVNDWPLEGICSTPYVEGNRVYYVSNRAEVMAADTEGFRDGENDGPVNDEAEKSPIDEDVVWRFDMIGELDVFPHNLAAGSPLVVGDLLYTVTGNGVDESHKNIPSPDAPTLIALRKSTGDLVWENNGPGEGILHGSWSNPSYAVIGGQAQVLYPGGNGWLYALEPASGKPLWTFDLNPKDAVYILGARGTRSYVIATPVIHDGLVYLGVGQDPEHGEGPGNFWAIDPAGKTGDITGSAVVWHVGGEAFHRTLSSAAVQDGLLYIADLSGFVYCFDAKSGKLYWKYDTMAAIWGSTFVADGKVYVGDEDGDLAVLRAGKKLEVLFTGNLGAAVFTTPTARDGVLYVASRTRLYALAEGVPPRPPAPRPPAAEAKPGS